MPAHVIVWKRNKWLAAYMPQDVAQHFDKSYYDADGFAVVTRILVSPIAYNTDLVKKEDAPKSFADLLDPKWAGKMVKAHPAYSGTIMNSTFQVARDLGWDYFEKLAKQRVLQVQSATDTPKKIALGERAVMVDGAGYLVIREKEAGKPVEIVYPTEGTPLATGPSAVFARAPNPNAARLFYNWMHGRDGQQMIVDVARQYSRAQADGGEARRPQDLRHQADEGGPGGRGKGRRRHQEALRADLQGVIAKGVMTMGRGLSRRTILKASAAAAATVFAAPLRAQAPAASGVTPALVEAARKEGKLVWYAAMDLPVSQAVARGFEAKYPGIAVRIERTGSERQFVRLAQEYASNIRVADVINSSDASHFIAWKRDGWLAPYVPEDVAKFFPGRAPRRRRAVRDRARLCQRARLQHQSGEDRRRAEELPRSARPQMEGQDRQGASGLQRHDHDRDLPDRARPRLGVLRAARQAERAAGAILGRSAEEACARRAPRDGGRQRLQRDPAQGAGPAGRGGLSGGGRAADRMPERA